MSAQKSEADWPGKPLKSEIQNSRAKKADHSRSDKSAMGEAQRRATQST